MAPTHVLLILTARAQAKVSFAVLNVDFVCGRPDSAFQICLLARAGSCKPKFHRRIPRLDGDWTKSTSEPLPIRATSLPCSFQLYGGRQALVEIRWRNSKQKQQRCPTLLRDWTPWDRDWPAIGGSPAKVFFYNPIIVETQVFRSKYVLNQGLAS